MLVIEVMCWSLYHLSPAHLEAKLVLARFSGGPWGAYALGVLEASRTILGTTRRCLGDIWELILGRFGGQQPGHSWVVLEPPGAVLGPSGG